MHIAEEISKLYTLYEQGSLTTEAFAQAKAQALHSVSPTNEQADTLSLQQQIAVMRQQQHLDEIERLDQEWQRERENYLLARNGPRHIPTPSISLVPILMGVFIAGAFIFMAFSRGMLFSGAIFGLLMSVALIINGVHIYINSQKYSSSEAKYWQQRTELTSMLALHDPMLMRNQNPGAEKQK